MPITLGILAQSRQAVAAGAFDLLESTVLTSTQSEIEFTNLTTKYAASYQHLQLRATVRTNRTAADRDLFLMRVNGDSSTNYSNHQLYGDGGSVISNGGPNEPYVYLGAYAPGLNATANQFSAYVVDILDAFETTKFKTVRTLSGGVVVTGESGINLSSGNWRNTASITTLRLYSLASLVSGTRISLYGIKATA